MSRVGVVLTLAAILTVTSQGPVHAGECVGPEEDYVSALEKGPRFNSRADSLGFDDAVYCLGTQPWVNGERWAGPIAAAGFAALRADTLRPRLRAALSSLLASPWADSGNNRHGLYRIAARHGISNVDSVDVFAMLLAAGRKPYPGVYQEMAILQDCRAVEFIRSRYLQLRDGSLVADYHGVRTNGAATGEMLDLLSCLYHILCKQAVLTAQQLYARETDPMLRERLDRVVNR